MVIIVLDERFFKGNYRVFHFLKKSFYRGTIVIGSSDSLFFKYNDTVVDFYI